jgi:hypothetical protein
MCDDPRLINLLTVIEGNTRSIARSLVRLADAWEAVPEHTRNAIREEIEPTRIPCRVEGCDRDRDHKGACAFDPKSFKPDDDIDAEMGRRLREAGIDPESQRTTLP